MKKISKDKELRRAKAFERQLRLLPIVLPICVVLLLVATVLSVVSSFQLARVKRNTMRLDSARLSLRTSELRACERVNVLRHRVNQNGSIIYRVLKAAAASDSSSRRAYRRIIASVEYAPLTNCGFAVDQAQVYTSPVAIPFQKLEEQGRFDSRTGEVKSKGKR